MKSSFKTCYAVLEHGVLTVGNDGIARRWDLSSGAPEVISVRDKVRNREWAAPEAPFKGAFRRDDLPLSDAPDVAAEADACNLDGARGPHLAIRVTLTYPNAVLNWTHRIWPGLPVVVSGYSVSRTGEAERVEPEEKRDVARFHFLPAAERLDYFRLAARHLDYHLTKFVAQSDYHDNLVVEQKGVLYNKEHHRLQGQFLHLRDRTAPGGLLAFKIAPPPDEQLSYPGYDFLLSAFSLALCGSGVSPEELATGTAFPSYASAVGATSGALEDGIAIFQELDRLRHPPKPARDFAVLANTWGGGHGDKSINEAMMKEEIRVAAELGLTHCQLDAGWQKGSFASLNVEDLKPKGPYGIDPDFWTVHPDKFPDGLAPVAAVAREKGIRLGFWFHPDGSNAYANWRKDADLVLHMCSSYGFDTVKIDGVSMRTKTAETNFRAFLERIYKQSEGRVCVNFDITGGKSVRLGHFYGTEHVGNLFIENRYSRDTSYYTFRTLRNLWQLCRYIPSYRLQMEFVDAQSRLENYDDDPLQPAAFGTEFSCACVLFANPLCWMEVAPLAEEDKAGLGKLIKAYRPHQEAILTGRVHPIGEEPGGRSWTGFQSVTGPGAGYLMILREMTPRPSARFRLHDVAEGRTMRFSRIAGGRLGGTATPDDHGEIELALPHEATYAFLEYSQI
jgi:hypothetical protein